MNIAGTPPTTLILDSNSNVGFNRYLCKCKTPRSVNEEDPTQYDNKKLSLILNPQIK